MTDILAARSHRPGLGIVLVALATLSFACGDVLTKHLATHHPVPLIVAVRNAFSLAVFVALAAPRHGAALWQTGRRPALVLRGLALAVGSLSMGLALRVMPVGETIAITYLAPFLVLLLAGRFLGERVGPADWLWSALGFAGVLVVLRPGGGLDPTGVALSLLNAASATVYLMTTRALSRTESTVSMLFHVLAVCTLVFTVLALSTPAGPMPGWHDLGLMALLGLLSLAGHFLITTAFGLAPAAILAPVNYVHLVWAALLGLVVFDHLPDGLTLTGMGLIVAAGAGMALRATRR